MQNRPYMMSVALYVACMALSLMYPFGKGMTTTDSPVKFLLAKATVMVIIICTGINLILQLKRILWIHSC